MRCMATPSDQGEALVEAVYAEHGAAMLAYATRLLRDRATAEDVVQEALLRVWRNPQVLVNGRGSVRAWLFTVVRNLVIDRIRARASRPAEVEEVPEFVAVQRDHAEDVVESAAMAAALDELSAAHRRVLVELYFRGRTMAEAAGVLDVPPGTVKSRAYYALKALREVIDRSRATAVR